MPRAWCRCSCPIEPTPGHDRLGGAHPEPPGKETDDDDRDPVRAEERRGKLAEDRALVRPTKLAHIVRRTSRFAEMVEWYRTVFEARIVHSDGMLAFLTYDDEHHRFAIVAISGLEEQSPLAAGTDHVAFTYADLGDLLSTYERLRKAAIEPYWCINHGPTTSMYFRDPDDSQVELQVDNFATSEDADRWMRSGEFAANPIGVVFEPADLVARYRRRAARVVGAAAARADRQIKELPPRFGKIRLSASNRGAPAAVSTTGSGSHGPTYSSRRARAEVSMSRQIRVVVVMRNALGSDTLSRSAPCQRTYASCTASSASAIDPSMRYARPSRCRRHGSKLAAGSDIALSELTPGP